MIIKGIRINYGIIDKTLIEDTIEDSVSSQSNFVAEDTTLQNIDKIKLAYLEQDYFVLDGSFVIPDDNLKYNVGWESASIADGSGNIDEYIEYRFGMYHSSFGINLRFPNNCIAKSFTISYYDGDLLLGSIEETNNTRANYSNMEYFANWNRVRIEFYKVNPRQRARLYFVSFGTNADFDENAIISISASKNIDLTADYSDTGEVSFEVYNDDVFNIKGIRDLPVSLQEGQRVIVYVKKDNDSIYNTFGEYYSQTTIAENKGEILKISGYDILYQLNTSIFRKGKVYPQGRSLADWAREVAEDCGVNVAIDTKLNNIISKGYITEVPHREAFRLIAEAGCCVLRVAGNDVIEIIKPSLEDKGELTQDDIVDGTETIENIDKVLGVSVSKYMYSLSPTANAQEIGYLEEIGLSSEPQEIEIVYSAYPVDIDSVQVFVANSATIVDKEIYSDRAVLTITGIDGDSTFVTLTGKPYNVVANIVSKGSVTKNVKKIENNFLITGEIAQEVVEYQYSKLANVYRHSGEIVTSKALELGDSVDFNGDNIAIENIGFTASYEDINVHISGAEIIDG